MVGDLGVGAFCWAESHSDPFHVFTGVVWLVAVIVGSPMWHVQRLEVHWGPRLMTGVTEMFSHPLSVFCLVPSCKRVTENLRELRYFTGGFASGIKRPEGLPLSYLALSRASAGET